jgi:hypothetical protein
MRQYLFIIACLLAQQGFSQLTYENLRVDYDSAWTYKNLKLIPIRYKGPGGLSSASSFRNTLSFNQALARGLITVEERGTTAIENVHWLSLYNNSANDIFIGSGEVLSGGRQDRMVSKDTLIAAKSGRTDLPVMCMEEGRWSKKNRKFEYRRIANTHLRKTLDESKSQVMIWREIGHQLETGKIRNKTLAYLEREKNKKFSALLNEYWQFFEQRFRQTDSNIVGMVCLSGNNVLGSDIFVAQHLFYGQLQPLALSYIEEAAVFGSVPTVTDATVKKYLDQFLVDEASQEAFVKKNGKLFISAGTVIHITTY